jgi:hypothetical protein
MRNRKKRMGRVGRVGMCWVVMRMKEGRVTNSRTAPAVEVAMMIVRPMTTMVMTATAVMARTRMSLTARGVWRIRSCGTAVVVMVGEVEKTVALDRFSVKPLAPLQAFCCCI